MLLLVITLVQYDLGGGNTYIDGLNKNGDIAGDGNIHIELSSFGIFTKEVRLAHEFGHAFGLAQNPKFVYQAYKQKVALMNALKLGTYVIDCQNEANRHEPFVETAKDWEERFIEKQKKHEEQK